jgi:peptidyl-prolyl cis-trans isomerase D
MAKERYTKIVSKKHLARMERERRQTTLITIVAAGILAIVLLMIGYGILQQTVLFNLQPILKVNKDTLSTREFAVRVKIARKQMINQYMQYEQLAQMLGVDPTTDANFSNYLSQIQSQLDDTTTLGNQVITSVENIMLARQYASANGIVVSAKDIDTEMQNAFTYFPSGTPTATLTGTPFAYSTLSSTQLFLFPPTATSTELPTGTSTNTPLVTPTITATFTVTPTVAPTSAATAAPTASPTPFTLQAYQTELKNASVSYAGLGVTASDFRRIFFEDNLYTKRVEDAIEANFPHTQEQIWARHILVADQATADKARAALVGGLDWTAAAKQYSTDSATSTSGGDLGWFATGSHDAAFDAAAFKLTIGEISQPVQGQDGWHIIQVLGHENRPLTASEYTTARDQAFHDWLAKQAASAKIKIYDYWTARVPTTPTIADTAASLQQTQAAQQGQLPTP